MTILRITDVNKSFGGLHAIRVLTLEVRAGQCFGIIGANGAGKTTLLNLITGYLRPARGKSVSTACLSMGRNRIGCAPWAWPARSRSCSPSPK